MAKEKEPDKVTHEVEGSIPFIPIGPMIHTTTIHKDGETYTGHGWSEEEANKDAGEKFSKGEKDR